MYPSPQEATTPPSVSSQKSVMLMTGVSASGIYDLMNRGLFPKSIKLTGGKSVAWLLSDIEEWQRQVIATANSANDAKAEIPRETTFNMADNRRDELALPGVFVVLPVYDGPLLRGEMA